MLTRSDTVPKTTTARSWRFVRSACGAVPLFAVLAALGGCAARGGAADQFPELVEFENRRISDVDFINNEPFREDSLLSITVTRESRCSLLGLPICVPFTSIGRETHRLSVGTIAADVRRLELFYRGQGFFGTAVSPDVEEDGDDVRVIFAINRGDAVLLDTIGITGTEPAFAPDSILPHLPLAPGDTFRLPEFAAAADTVLFALQERGHAWAQVLRNYGVDTVTNRASAFIEAVPGPRAIVDSVIVLGADNLGRRATLQQLTLRKGEVLRRRSLVESQRNLYGLELVQFAGVSIAPDTLQLTPFDSTSATIVVRIAEAPVHQVDASVGYGTVECGRAEVRWVNRSFLGGARRLALTGSVSKLGVGVDRVNESVCGAFERGDTLIARGLDYRFAATLTQPYFLSPNNRITATLYADRISEPRVFQREAEGGQVAFTRRLGDRTFFSPDLEIVRTRTLASPALYCVAFQVCLPATIDSLAQSQWRNTFGTTFTHDRTDNALDPTRGFRLNATTTWASRALGSDIEYLRFTADGTIVRRLRPGWVGAVIVRLGSFFSTVSLDPSRSFLPPEERFYAGGQNTVRGFSRNALGPGVYVTSRADSLGEPIPEEVEFVPVGGTALTVASAEVRFPSPFLPRILRLAAFVDAGNVGYGNIWDLTRQGWRVTPGMGLRLNTPVGPVRLDLGFNPHGPETAPLFYADAETGALIQLQSAFTPEQPTFLDRLRLHIAVGQPF